MKLADLLARELESWPKGVDWICQDHYETLNKRLVGFKGLKPEFNGIDNQATGQRGNCWSQFASELASDHSTVIITREQWQSARDKLKGETKVTKPKGNKDGWIRHRGGRCPVDGDVHVEYRMRDWTGCGQLAKGVRWNHAGIKSDVMAYRIREPKQSIATVTDIEFDEEGYSMTIEHGLSVGDTVEVEMPAAKYFDGPLQWRDRILELDREQVTADFDHKAATDARDAEKAELVAKLKLEGLALVSELVKVGESAQLDMGDWRNWIEGDLVEVINETEHSEVKKGVVMPIESIDEHDREQPIWIGAYCPHISALKWHSRPSKP